MRRALRWLWRMFCRVAMAGAVLLLAAPLLLTAPRSMAFAEPPPGQNVQAPAPTPGTPLTPQERQHAHVRAQQGRAIYFSTLLYEVVLLGGFLLLGGTRWLARLAAWFGSRWLLAVLAIFALFSLAATVLTLPLEYYAGFIFAHKWGLSNQTPLQWLRDYSVSQGLGLLVGLPLVALVYYIFRRAPRTWWLWMGALSVPVLVFSILIEPVFVAPLFNKFTPLQNVQLRDEILAIAHRRGSTRNMSIRWTPAGRAMPSTPT